MDPDAPKCFRELKRDLRSHCCEAIVFEQFYPIKRWVPLTISPVRLHQVWQMHSFYECDRCQRRCNGNRVDGERAVSRAAPVTASNSALEWGDAKLREFVRRYRAHKQCVLLPDTTVLDEVFRYQSKYTGDPCASMRTDQHICPLSKRLHENNTIVLRFNFAKREMVVSCYCNPTQTFARVPLEIQHPAECRCWSCIEGDVRDMYEG